MYRMNYNGGSSQHGRFDESLLARIAEQNGIHCKGCNTQRNDRRSCGCERAVPEKPAKDNCGCEHYEGAEYDYSLAMVYPPHQEWQNLYCEEEGFIAGTIFKELDKPFYGPRCYGGNCYE